MKENMFYGADRIIFQRAKELRNKLTDTEIQLWEMFLKEKPEGCKFRRQHPLGFYIADFYCHKLKLVIEIDGKIHEKKEVSDNDIVRQKSIELKGVSVIRFKNEEIFKQFDTVVEKIKEFIINRQSQDIDRSKKPL